MQEQRAKVNVCHEILLEQVTSQSSHHHQNTHSYETTQK
jgi:hypothetical protein